jgi:hypothetical protein
MIVIFAGAIILAALWLNHKAWNEDLAPVSYERHAEQSNSIMLWIFGIVAAFMLIGLCAHTN